MPLSVMSKTRNQIAAIADTTTGLVAGQNKLVLKNWNPTDEFLLNLVATGPWVFIRPAVIQDIDGQTNFGTFEVRFDIVFGFALDADYDFTAIETIIAALVANLFTTSLWSAVNSGISRLRCAGEPDVVWDKPSFARYTFIGLFQLCAKNP